MARPKPMQVAMPMPHPFVRAFPRLSLAVGLTGAVLNVAGRLVGGVWPFWRELTVLPVLAVAWYGAGQLVPGWWALAVALVLIAGSAAIPPVRAWVWGWWRCARTCRLVVAGLRETRSANPSGRLPRVVKVVRTPVGERAHLSVKAGQSAELLDARVEGLRPAVRARDVRVTRDPNRSHRVLLDVVRRDPLAASADVTWLDHDADVLSMWDPVHLGVAETGEPVRLSFRERSLLTGVSRGRASRACSTSSPPAPPSPRTRTWC